MIKKLDRTLRHERDSGFTISEPVSIGEMQEKVNELVDAVNLLQCKNVHIESDLQDLMYPKEIKGELAENVQPDYVTTTYPTDGHTQEYYGQNGASIVTDHPLPAGYIITIRETETKGGDNE